MGKVPQEKMKKMTAKCPMCGDTYEYIDMRNIPKTCGRRMCEVNYRYAQKFMDPLTGKVPRAEEISKL